MMSEMNARWVSPEAPVPLTTAAGQYRQADKAVFRFGILDNAKSNADHLLGMLVDSLQSHKTLTSVIRRRKPGPAFAAKVDIIDDLAREADLVVSAMAD